MQQGKPSPAETHFRPIDIAFGQYIAGLGNTHSSLIRRLACQCSFDTSQGHVCTYLDEPPPKHISISTDDNPQSPLVYFNHALYLQRNFIAERFLYNALFSNNPYQAIEGTINSEYDKESAQHQAILKTLNYRISAISGSPGTGKSTLIAHLAKLFTKQGKQVALCAPTGKAASRLNQATAQHQLDLPAKTIERLLGTNPRNNTQRFDTKYPLPIDVLIIDEAAMVDNQRLYKLFKAVPEHAHIIMAGDHQQLPAIESGQVMQALFDNQHPLPEFCTVLTTNYRFSSATALGQLAIAIEQSDMNRLESLLTSASSPLVDKTIALNQALSHYQEYHQQLSNLDIQTHAHAAHRAFQAFQILTAMRQGPEGSEFVNHWINQQLKHDPKELAHATPIIITQNTPWLNLFNGDIGIVDAIQQHVVFLQGDEPYVIPLPNLPKYELAYALTVHKAQGSEFDEILCLFLSTNPCLLSKAMLYTAITRARKQTYLISDQQTLQFALNNQPQRHHNLRVHNPCR